MSAPGSLFLSRHRLRDVCLGVDDDGENRDGGGGSSGSGGDLAAQRCTDTKFLTGNVDSARSDVTGPAGMSATDNSGTTQPTIDQDQDQSALLLSMVSNRLDHMQAALLERLDRIDSANSTNAASQITTVNAQYAAIMERLDCMDAKIDAQQELLLQLKEAVTGRYRDG